MTRNRKITEKEEQSFEAWMAVSPKSGKPWSEPWIYMRKTKPRHIELSGFKAVRVKITVQREAGDERKAHTVAPAGPVPPQQIVGAQREWFSSDTRQSERCPTCYSNDRKSLWVGCVEPGIVPDPWHDGAAQEKK